MKKNNRVPANLRHTAILTELNSHGHASVSDLAEWLGVTEMTIRRDLDQLEVDGAIVRTHGGAHIPGALKSRALQMLEPSLEHRAQSAHLEKKRIAQAAKALLPDEGLVAFDIGTSILELAALITAPAPIVMTGSLPIQKLLVSRGVHVMVPGGRMRGKEPSISGAQAVTFLEDYFFDVCFIGLAGITIDGIYDYSVDDSEIKKVLIKQSKLRVALADQSKFETISTIRFGKLENIDVLITDAAPRGELAEHLKKIGCKVIVAE